MAAAAALLALVAPAASAAGGQAPLADRTRQTGLPLTPAQDAAALPYLALSLTVDPVAKRIAGEARYRVRASAPLDRVQFDLDPRLGPSRVTVGGEPLARSAWRNDGGLLTIELPAPLAAGAEAEIAIAYAGVPFVAPRAPWDGGFVWSETPGGQPWIATAVQGEGCDLFWPCVDNPTRRVALLDLSVTVPEPLVEAGNGVLVGEQHANGWATWHWRARYPQSYGVALQIAPYQVARRDYASRYGDTIPLAFWHLPGDAAGAEKLLGELAQFLDFFESTIGPYPFGDEKAGIAQTPHLGMEHQTINAYGNGFKPAPEGYDWLLNHEFAHEWFANQATARSEAGMWLHEGFAMYMQPLFLRWKDGDLLYHETLWDYRKKIVAKVPLEPAPGTPPPDYLDEQSGWGQDIYYKGAWILHTLREQIGDAAFDETLRRFVYGRPDPAPGKIAPLLRTGEDYRRIVEQVTGKNWGWFFDAYLHHGPLPKLVATRDGARLSLHWQVEGGGTFPLPVEVRIGGRTVTVPMAGGTGSVELGDPDAHVVLDPAGKILRDDPAIAAWQRWTAQQAAAKP